MITKPPQLVSRKFHAIRVSLQSRHFPLLLCHGACVPGVKWPADAKYSLPRAYLPTNFNTSTSTSPAYPTHLAYPSSLPCPSPLSAQRQDGNGDVTAKASLETFIKLRRRAALLGYATRFIHFIRSHG